MKFREYLIETKLKPEHKKYADAIKKEYKGITVISFWDNIRWEMGEFSGTILHDNLDNWKQSIESRIKYIKNPTKRSIDWDKQGSKTLMGTYTGD